MHSMSISKRLFLGMAAAIVPFAAAQAAQPVEKGIHFQETVTPVGEYAIAFHDYWLMPLITVITLIVLALLAYTVVRFRASANPVPSKTTHNALIEVVWTVVPVILLVIIAFPSWKLLQMEGNIPKADVVIKATGHQWYWSYEYAGQDIGFDSLMLSDADAKKAGEPRLLAVDNRIVVPVNKVVKVQTTAADVIHAFAVPAFFVKIDAVPGRINETWFKATKTGVYYGQCSELCGIRHGYMPIAVEVVSEQQYTAWLAEAKTKFALNDSAKPVQYAAVAPAAARP
jgi:cytochrome c oxidase subunit II